MVSEFVNFARIPVSQKKPHNIVTVIKDAIFSEKAAFDDINIEYIGNVRKLIVNIDQTQIYQVLTNVIRNSCEAMLIDKITHPKIEINLINHENYLELFIVDNGKGFDKDLINNLTEPYITTKSTGTGLGLAIVKKIVEDHAGTIYLYNNSGMNGACVKIKLPIIITEN
jgi:two-component system nitrogen regulation sensor histidine kinase NtrY